MLDDYDVRGHKIKVQRAKFQMRGAYNPALKPKKKKQDKEKLKRMQEKYISSFLLLLEPLSLNDYFADSLIGVQRRCVANVQNTRKSLLSRTYLHRNCSKRKSISYSNIRMICARSAPNVAPSKKSLFTMWVPECSSRSKTHSN